MASLSDVEFSVRKWMRNSRIVLVLLAGLSNKWSGVQIPARIGLYLEISPPHASPIDHGETEYIDLNCRWEFDTVR